MVIGPGKDSSYRCSSSRGDMAYRCSKFAWLDRDSFSHFRFLSFDPSKRFFGCNFNFTNLLSSSFFSLYKKLSSYHLINRITPPRPPLPPHLYHNVHPSSLLKPQPHILQTQPSIHHPSCRSRRPGRLSRGPDGAAPLAAENPACAAESSAGALDAIRDFGGGSWG